MNDRSVDMTEPMPIVLPENRAEQFFRIALPVGVLVASIGMWEYLCWLWETPHYKVPRHVRVVDEFPMTVTGKVQKFVMREQMIAELGSIAAATA